MMISLLSLRRQVNGSNGAYDDTLIMGDSGFAQKGGADCFWFVCYTNL